MDYVNTILTSSDANAFFGSTELLLGNTVLESTLRYIAMSRHQGDMETVKLIKASSTNYRGGDSGNRFTERATDNELVILTKSGGDGDIMPTIDLDGWVSLDTPPYPVAPFLSKYSETRVFVNEREKRTIIFVKTATDNWIDALCSSIFRILPWRFPNNVVTDNEKELFTVINKKDANRFKQIVDGICADFDFRAHVTKRTLLGWGDAYRKEQLSSLYKQGESTRQDISAKEEKLAIAYNTLSGILMNIQALERMQPGNDTALFDFFNNHQQLAIYKVANSLTGGKDLWYSISDTIEWYSKDEFIRVYENPSSYFYAERLPDGVRKIIYEIFANERGVFKTHCVFILHNLASITVARGCRPDECWHKYLPHPHLVHHGCLGGNENYINTYMQEGSWDLAIEQTIAAAKNINFGDPIVVKRFMRDVAEYMDTCKCIIADNGTEMTPREFLAYIEKEENEDTNNG